jgi:hypothetical protein
MMILPGGTKVEIITLENGIQRLRRRATSWGDYQTVRIVDS